MKLMSEFNPHFIMAIIYVANLIGEGIMLNLMQLCEDYEELNL